MTVRFTLLVFVSRFPDLLKSLMKLEVSKHSRDLNMYSFVIKKGTCLFAFNAEVLGQGSPAVKDCIDRVCLHDPSPMHSHCRFTLLCSALKNLDSSHPAVLILMVFIFSWHW